MSGGLQTVFVTRPQPTTAVTFILATQQHGFGQKERYMSKINSHLANHGRLKRRNKLLQNQSPDSIDEPDIIRSPNEENGASDIVEIRRQDARKSRSPGYDSDAARSPNSHRLDSLFQGALDPFLRLPIKISQQDSALLSYYLLEGKNNNPGTSRNPRHCVSIRIARDWIQYSPLHTMQTLISMEFMISRATGQSLPASYHKRRMQTLALVRETISSTASTYSYKLYAIMVLVWMAYTMEWPDLETHLNAINILLQSTEGSQQFVPREQEGPTLRPQWIVGMFLVNEYRIATFESLCAIKTRFMKDLAGIYHWTLQHTPREAGMSTATLAQLRGFLYEPLESYRFSTELPFAIAAAPFFCGFNICATLAEKRMSPREASEYLVHVQSKLEMIESGCSFGGTALSHLLADARWETSVVPEADEHISEVAISQSVMNALKLYSLLSTDSRAQLTQMLYDTIFAYTTSKRSITHAWDEQLGGIHAQIEFEWWQRQH